ncbi:MAG: hypothetical protein ABL967_01790 [Bryobacteraceae bacterium]
MRRFQFHFDLLRIALYGFLGAVTMSAQGPGGPPPPPRQGAVIDITGHWVAQVSEDWRWRMVTPPKGDYASVPLNAEGKRVADMWDPAKDEASGGACKAYGAAGLMRLPTRLHIAWADDNTVKLDTDAGQQTRLLRFGVPKPPAGELTWQGESTASWQKQSQQSGFGPPFSGPAAGKGGALKVVTTRMKPGYLRKNGVPYSANAVLTEYFDRVELDGVSYLIITSVVEDRQYLNDVFLTSEQFKLEPDGSKWNPAPCKAQ